MATQNYATTIAPKASTAIREQTSAPWWFEHAEPAKPGGLTVPTFPGTLSLSERAEVEIWLAASDCQKPEILLTLTSRFSIAKVEEYKTYFADPKYAAWSASNQLDRIAQWRNATGSAVIGNEDALPVSLDVTGVGTPRSGDILPPGEDVPQCESVSWEIASGTLGGAITLELTCGQPASTIHFRLPAGSGSWITYSGPVGMTASQIIEYYASAPDVPDSETDTFENS